LADALVRQAVPALARRANKHKCQRLRYPGRPDSCNHRRRNLAATLPFASIGKAGTNGPATYVS